MVICALLFKRHCFWLLAANLILANRADATPVLWDKAAGGNGNSYEVINGAYSWTQARDLAKQMGGHLV